MGYADLTITADNARLLVEEADGTNIAWVGDHTGDGHGGLLLYNHGGTATVKLTADSHANYINNGNNFGIGTASPANKLQVGATTGGYGGNHFHIGDGTTAFAIYLDPTTDNSHFYTNTSYSFLKSGGSTGYVGINTTTPQKTLHIEHTAGASEGILISGASDTTGHTAGILLRAEGGEADSTLRAKGGIFFERTGTYGVGKLHLCNNDSDNNNSTTLSDARLTLNEDVTEVKRPLVNKINNGSVNGNAKHYTNLAAADLYNESNGYTIIDTKIPHYGYTNDRNMIMIRMQGYGYDADDTGTIDFTVGAYVGESATHNPTCSGPAIPNAWKGNIYFYRNTSTNCVSVVLGTSSSLVNYSLVVTDFIQSFTNQVEGHAVGWNIKRAANLTGYDRGTSIRNRFSTSVPAFRAYLGSTTSVSAGTSTLTSGMTENFDKQGNFNPSNGRFTAPQSGIYQFNATVTMAASTTSVTYLSAEVVHTPSGGSAQRYVVGGWNSKTSTTNAYASSAGSVTIEMNAGDYVVLGYETSAAINLQGSLGHTSISGFLVA